MLLINTQYIFGSRANGNQKDMLFTKNGIRPEYSVNESFIGDNVPYDKVLKSEQ